MLRRSVGFCICVALATSLAAATAHAEPATRLTAAEIVNRNVAARGGLETWRAVHTMSMTGKLGAGGNQRATLTMPMAGEQVRGDQTARKEARRKFAQQVSSQRPAEETQLPFVMRLERPRKIRFELEFKGQTAVQVFDGTNGWKVRPFLNRNDVEPYTADEMKKTSTQADLDGPLVDYAAKGTRVELVGTEKIEGRDAYKLKLTLKSGQAYHVWIDSHSFLEAKIEGQPRRMDGVYHPVEVYYRDYRAVDGLQIPFVLETRVLPVARTALGFQDPPVPAERITIDKVVVNPKLDESLFSKPQVLAMASPTVARAGN